MVTAVMNEKIEAAIALLEQELAQPGGPPAVVVMESDSHSILGNRGGYLNLALASLSAAQGQDQELGDQAWAWEIDTLKFNADAHIDPPKRITEWHRRAKNALNLALLALILTFLIIGLLTVLRWIWGWIKWP